MQRSAGRPELDQLYIKLWEGAMTKAQNESYPFVTKAIDLFGDCGEVIAQLNGAAAARSRGAIAKQQVA